MSTRKHSNAQEKAIASVLGGRKQSNSGATPFQKGDVATKQFLIECKTKIKEAKSMSIKKAWIEEIKEECFAMGKSYWALAFNFGSERNAENYYIVDERLFKELVDYLGGT